MSSTEENEKSNMKVAVIVQSYYRKDGSSKKILMEMFKMLEEQKYKNFKVFITGDNYQPVKEFEEICSTYNGDIYIHNNKHSCRELNLGRIQNYWCVGGVHAAKNSYIKAMEEGYDIALMLDDDDYWYDTHVNTVVNNFIAYPETGFMVTKAEWCGGILPRTSENNIFYNNYIPKVSDSVRAASAHNINIVGQTTMETWKKIIENVKKLHITEPKYNLYYADAQLLNDIAENIKLGKYKSLYIPVISVRKLSDDNWANIL